MHFRFGPFALDTDTAELSGPEGVIVLRPMSLKVLMHLLQSAPNLVAHDALLDAVWGRQAVSQGVVSQSIRELRRALGDSAQEPIYIETRHRLGYRFVAQLERVDSSRPTGEAARPTAPSLVKPPVSSDPSPGLSGKRGRVAATLAALIVAAAVWHWQRPDSQPGARAVSAQESVLTTMPQEPESGVRYLQGIAFVRQGRLPEARAQFERALQREPGALAPMAALAEVLGQLGETALARQWSDSALQGAANLPRADQLRLEGLNAALGYRWNEAISHYTAVFGLDAGDSGTGFRLFEAQLAAGRSVDARATLAAIELLPAVQRSELRLHLAKARLATLAGDQAMRLELARAAEQLAQDPEARIEAQIEQGWALLLLGEMASCRETLDAIEARLQATPWLAGEMRAGLLRATLQRETGEFEAAIASFEAAAQQAESLGDRAALIAARREAAFAMTSSGNLPGAAKQIDALIAEAEASGNLRELASTLDVAAIVRQRMGDQTAAMEFSDRALQAYVQAGDIAGAAAVRTNLGMLFGRLGRSADAQEHLELALTAFRATGNRRGAAVALSNLAILYGRAGRVDAAREANETALADFRAAGARLDIARIQFNLGVQDRRAGSVSSAETRMREALAEFDAMGAGDFALAVAAALADLLLLRAEPAEAEAVLASVEEAEASPQRAAALATVRGRLATQQGDFETAAEAFTRARALRDQAGLAAWVRSSELDLAELAARQGRLVESEHAARALRRAMLEAGEAPDAAAAGVLLAAVLVARGRLDAAQRLLDEIEVELATRQDALTGLRVDLVRAAAQQTEREAGLLLVAQRARATGLEWLALRAELLADGEAGSAARRELARRGVPDPGLVPPLSL